MATVYRIPTLTYLRAVLCDGSTEGDQGSRIVRSFNPLILSLKLRVVDDNFQVNIKNEKGLG